VTRYRAGIVGLGRMGWLYDAAVYDRAQARPPAVRDPTGALTTLPPLMAGSPSPAAHPGREGLPQSYAEAFWLHPQTELVAGCDTAPDRRAAFGAHYGIAALYHDYRDCLRAEGLDIVAITSTADLRPDATQFAVECGARAIITEKPMAASLAGADVMVEVCARAGVPLACGNISVSHPAFGNARAQLEHGAIGSVLSLDTGTALAQHNPWIYLVDSPAVWVVGTGDAAPATAPEREFRGAGLIRFQSGVTGSVRPGAPLLRLTGERGELTFDGHAFRLWQDVVTVAGPTRVEVPFPTPNLAGEWSALYTVDDAVACLERGGEPRVSGRRVRDAMEIELALRESQRRGHVRVDLPLADRSLRLHYDWFR